MGMIVEDGSGLTNSNSYVSLSEADAYWELRNDTQWSGLSDDAKTASLVRAAQYMDFTYRWVGDRYSATQAMTWPRVVFWDRDGRAMYANEVPQRVKDAQCELAREDAVNGPLGAPQDRAGRVQNETIGPLSVTYFQDAPADKSFPLVERIIADLITPESSGSLTMGALLS